MSFVNIMHGHNVKVCTESFPLLVFPNKLMPNILTCCRTSGVQYPEEILLLNVQAYKQLAKLYRMR